MPVISIKKLSYFCCRTEVYKYKKKLDEADTHRQCLEEKLTYLRLQSKEAQQAKADVASLRIKLDRLQR